MADVHGYGLFSRLSCVEALVEDLHWCLIGQYRAQFCPSVDVGARVPSPCEPGQAPSSAKRRRIRAIRTRGRLCVASIAKRDEPGDFTGFWEQMESSYAPPCKREWCANERAISQENEKNENLTESIVLEGEAWYKETCLLVNRCKSLEEIDEVLERRWREKSKTFPLKLQAALREGLEELRAQLSKVLNNAKQ